MPAESSWTPAEERAAKAICEFNYPDWPGVWDKISDDGRVAYRQQAHAALSAAAVVRTTREQIETEAEQHKFKPETTNGGNCFADCSCGWGGGVHPSRPSARMAWQAHCDGTAGPSPIPVTVLVGPPISCGCEAAS